MSWTPAFRLEGVAEARPYSARADQKRNCASAWIIPRLLCRGKIKLLASGCLLVFYVEDERVVVAVVAVGKRERVAAYQSAKDR